MGRTKKLLISAAIAVVVLTVLGATFGNGDSRKSARPLADDAPSPRAITGRVFGVFRRSCALCDHRLKSYIRTGHVWCGWQNGTVLIHVTMRNTSAEHVTVNWHPAYVIARGGEHGKGRTSIESNRFDPGERRQLLAKKHPKGVRDGSRISVCKPSFSTIQSG